MDRRDDKAPLALASFVSDAMSGLDEMIGRQRAVPDLQDVVARAHALDPEEIPEACVSATADLALVVPLQAGHTRTESPDLAPFLDEVREHLDGLATERRMAQIPAPGRSVARSRAPWVVVPVALAAALVLAFGLVRGLERSPAESTQSPAAGAANASVERTPGTAEVRERTPPRRRPVAPAVAEVEEPEQDSSTADEPQPAAKPKRQSRLERLSLEAETLWRAGDIPAAERTLRQIVRTGGRSRHADLAYGDLFTIAYQVHGPSQQSKLWRAYLARFPRGRYADDARAGMCRVAEAGGRRACWQRYLRRSPKGSHRGEALRATGK